MLNAMLRWLSPRPPPQDPPAGVPTPPPELEPRPWRFSPAAVWALRDLLDHAGTHAPTLRHTEGGADLSRLGLLLPRVTGALCGSLPMAEAQREFLSLLARFPYRSNRNGATDPIEELLDVAEQLLVPRYPDLPAKNRAAPAALILTDGAGI